MAVLSLFEAAEQAATSKVDVWRAIQEGRKRATAATLSIRPTCSVSSKENSRIPLELSSAPDEAPVAKTDEASDPAATNDVSVAFAALQAELKSLLGSRGEGAPASEEKRHDESKRCSDAEQNGRLTADLAGEKAEAGRAIAESAALADKLATLTETHRTWWRRLVC